ncbi:MAG: hypothetical protein C5B51_30120 [Terriglobia bacterium]|nr:MAG: hypothetical protein C5B51_30120 [Terriglobia bacterium]
MAITLPALAAYPGTRLAMVPAIQTTRARALCFCSRIRLLSEESISFNRVRDQTKRRLGNCLRAKAWLLTILFPAVLPADSSVAMTRVSATGPDVLFQVDQQWVSGNAVFAWPAGSKHTLRIDPLTYSPLLLKTRYFFNWWQSSAGPLSSPSNEVVITADPRITWYNADLKTQYAITLSFYPCTDQPCNSPGTVWVGQVPFPGNTDVWCDAGVTVAVEAVPNTGYVFAGWWQGGGSLGPLYSFVVNAPVTVYPRFSPARKIQLSSSPQGLQLLADRTVVFAPVTLEWGFDTRHDLGVVTPQRDNHGRTWVFQSWSDGGLLNHSYSVAPMTTADSVEARFVRAVETLVATEPPGLSVKVDGGDVTTPKDFFWGAGDTHTLAAPLHQIDATGAPWTFRAWSNGAPAQQTIQLAPEQADGGIRVTAVYNPLSRIRMESVPNGVPVTVDGADCITPCEIERAVGASVRLVAPPALPGGDGVRYQFEGWEGAEGGSLQASAGFRRVTARYSAWYRLTLASRPADSGSWQATPSSADGFYPAGTSVALAFLPASGMQFQGWELDLAGTNNPASLVMNAPHSVRAAAQALPPAPPRLRVSSAAGDTTAVAPGSIVSLFGAELAGVTAGSTADPLPQSLGGVSIRCAGRLMPLLYVSPGQINFQMAGDLEPGAYKLELYREGAPVRSADFTVESHVPGLFTSTHADGSAITPDSPAHSGERVVLYGTGFGPYVFKLLDGFRVPASPPDPVTDTLEVLVSGRVLTPEFAGATPGMTGIAMVQVVLPQDMPEAETEFSVRIGGVESNQLRVMVR